MFELCTFQMKFVLKVLHFSIEINNFQERFLSVCRIDIRSKCKV